MADDLFDDYDPTDIASAARARIEDLKRSRAERINEVVAGWSAAMEDLRARVVTYCQEKQAKNAGAASESLTKMITAVERRMEIEDRMGQSVAMMNQKIQAVEDMMKIGYSGRERDMNKAKGVRDN